MCRVVTHRCGERRFNNRNLQMHRRATRLHCDVDKFISTQTRVHNVRNLSKKRSPLMGCIMYMMVQKCEHLQMHTELVSTQCEKLLRQKNARERTLSHFNPQTRHLLFGGLKLCLLARLILISTVLRCSISLHP